MDEETTSVLHADILRAVSKEGRPYECIEVKLGDVSVGRIFPPAARNGGHQERSRLCLSVSS